MELLLRKGDAHIFSVLCAPNIVLSAGPFAYGVSLKVCNSSEKLGLAPHFTDKEAEAWRFVLPLI